MKKKALIIGSEGQDGRLLTQLLSKKKYEIHAIINEKKIDNFQYKIFKNRIDIFNSKKLRNYFANKKFDEVYFLAVKNINTEIESDNITDLYNLNLNTIGLINVLNNVKLNKKTKFFYSSSSHIFNGSNRKINENFVYKPFNMYGLSKLIGMKICNYYKNNFGVFCSTGILFSHTSYMAKENFLINRIIKTILVQKSKNKIIIQIGNPKLKVHAFAAQDAVSAIYKIMRLKKPETFIICGTKTYVIEKIIKDIALIIAPKSKIEIIKNKKIMKNNTINKNLIGNNTKLIKKTGWRDKISFKEIVFEILKYYKEIQEK